MRRRIVKSCFSLAAILLWGIFGTFTSVHSAAAQSASAWPLVNCAINTPCVNNEPVNTHTGDSLPVAMSKLNADIKQLAVMFGSLSNLALNGSAKASDIIGLWTNCSSIDPVLGYQGTCISGGSGGSFTVDTAPSGISVTPDCADPMTKVTATDYLIAAPVQSAPTTASTGGTLAGGDYFYVVTALTSAGQTTPSTETSINSDTLAAPTQSAPTTAITGGTLSAGTYYYVVTALNSSGQTVASNEESIADTGTVAAPTAGTATTATTGGSSLAASTTYYMVVTATTPNGQSTISSVESVATGTGTTNTVTAAWTDVTGATGYDVYISTSTITAGEATVAYQTAASTATSSTFTAVPSTTATTPSSNTATTNTNENVITWAAISGATGYDVYRGTAAGAENVYYSPGNVTTYTDTNATSTSGSPPALNTAYLTATNENVISWAAVTGATGYDVYRGTSSGGENVYYAPGNVTTYTDTGATSTSGTPPTTNTSGQFTINAPSGCTPFDGQRLEIKVISPSGGIVTYAPASAYVASGQLAFPTTSYAAGKEDYFMTQYDADLSGWVVLSYNQGF